MTLFRRFPVPAHRFLRIYFYAAPEIITLSQPVLGLALISRLPVPAYGFCVILLHAFPEIITISQIVLSRSIFLIRLSGGVSAIERTSVPL